MKREDFRKRATEDFKRMLPQLNQLLHQVQLTDKMKEYDIHGYKFLLRLNQDIIEMSLSDEKPIFPTLAFRPIDDIKADLLYFRIRDEFRIALNNAIL
jgi:hypothetical protein